MNHNNVSRAISASISSLIIMQSLGRNLKKSDIGNFVTKVAYTKHASGKDLSYVGTIYVLKAIRPGGDYVVESYNDMMGSFVYHGPSTVITGAYRANWINLADIRQENESLQACLKRVDRSLQPYLEIHRPSPDELSKSLLQLQ